MPGFLKKIYSLFICLFRRCHVCFLLNELNYIEPFTIVSGVFQEPVQKEALVVGADRPQYEDWRNWSLKGLKVIEWVIRGMNGYRGR
jgi:hypothetical protein